MYCVRVATWYSFPAVTVDVDSDLGSYRIMDEGSVADVSELHVDFRVEVSVHA
jgi:hypothetical protein